jgi:hypothetical protein
MIYYVIFYIIVFTSLSSSLLLYHFFLKHPQCSYIIVIKHISHPNLNFLFFQSLSLA